MDIPTGAGSFGRLFFCGFTQNQAQCCDPRHTGIDFKAPPEPFDSCNISPLGAQWLKMWAKDPRTEA
jgi:hypothetical protein